jgi:myo-inositol-1(or 4)-monophosphatase
VRDYRELAAVACSAAERAAGYIRSAERPGAGANWERKGPLDFVTDVDRESEELITHELIGSIRGSRVLGEELSKNASASAPGDKGEVLWIVDPLDGTTNYLHAYPQYAVSIAAMVEGQLVAGVVADVARSVLYHATAGGGAWCAGERLRVSDVADPSQSLIGTGFPFRTPHQLPRYLRQFTAITHAVSGVRRAGSAALDLADVALGRFEGFWELELAPWDMAAGVLLIREAGGLVTDLDGSPDVVRQGPLVAGNPAMHGWLLQLLHTC